MRSLIHLLSLFILAATTALASPASPGGPAHLARRSLSGHNAAHARSAADTSHLPETNAQRFARGLSPLAPKRLFSPTRVRRGALPSSAPTITGKIGAFKKSDGSAQGYWFGNTGVGAAQTSGNTFNFRTPTSASDLVELNISGTSTHTAFYSNQDPPYVGPGSGNELIMVTTTFSTPAGSKQQADIISVPWMTVYSESTVWSIDPSTGVVSAVWVNADGSTVPIYFLMFTLNVSPTVTVKYIRFVGDVAVYKAKFPAQILDEVTLVVAV